MYIPHLHTPNSMFLFKNDRLAIEMLQGFDVVVVQRQLTPANQRAMKILHENGKKIVYDTDDVLWGLPSYNPAKKAFEAMQEGFALCIREADVITVSTSGLKSAITNKYPDLKAPIFVVPNSLDCNLIAPTLLNRTDGRIVIGWGGSNTHSGDLDEAASIIPGILNKYKNVYFEFVGMIPDKLRGLERVSFKPWVPVSEWNNRFPNFAWDIAIAPLQDNRFNRCKSGLKLYESAAVKIPCLASDVWPYREFCALGGKDLEWLLCRFPSDFEKKLDRLINDPLYRNFLGDAMYQTARTYFNIERNKELWFHAFRTAMTS